MNKANLCSWPEIAILIAMSRFYSHIITDIIMVLPVETFGYASSFRHTSVSGPEMSGQVSQV